MPDEKEPILVHIPINDDGTQISQEDFSTESGTVNVIFRNHLENLAELIQHAARMNLICVGAIAWLTDPHILYQLTKLRTHIIVQKEDFLRPDVDQDNPYSEMLLRTSYEDIKGLETRYDLPGIYSKLSYATDPILEGVRCLGNRPEPGVASPKMHNKFFVFSSIDMTCPPNCTSKERDELCPNAHQRQWQPQFVWTGSYNVTISGRNSWENSLIIQDVTIAQAYLDEWCQLLALSEQLDWEDPYVTPQWRIGT